MVATINNILTQGRQLAELRVEGHKLFVHCLNIDLDFICEPVEEIDNWMLNWIFSEEHSDWVFGLNGFEILQANVPIKQDSQVQDRKFLAEMKKRYKV